jgi:hypothetical protein
MPVLAVEEDDLMRLNAYQFPLQGEDRRIGLGQCGLLRTAARVAPNTSVNGCRWRR